MNMHWKYIKHGNVKHETNSRYKDRRENYMKNGEMTVMQGGETICGSSEDNGMEKWKKIIVKTDSNEEKAIEMKRLVEKDIK